MKRSKTFMQTVSNGKDCNVGPLGKFEPEAVTLWNDQKKEKTTASFLTGQKFDDAIFLAYQNKTKINAYHIKEIICKTANINVKTTD